MKTYKTFLKHLASNNTKGMEKILNQVIEKFKPFRFNDKIYFGFHVYYPPNPCEDGIYGIIDAVLESRPGSISAVVKKLQDIFDLVGVRVESQVRYEENTYLLFYTNSTNIIDVSTNILPMRTRCYGDVSLTKQEYQDQVARLTDELIEARHRYDEVCSVINNVAREYDAYEITHEAFREMTSGFTDYYNDNCTIGFLHRVGDNTVIRITT